MTINPSKKRVYLDADGGKFRTGASYTDLNNDNLQSSVNNILENLVSEYNMPNDFKCIWQRERKVQQKSDRVAAEKATEKLFIYNG